MSSPILPTYPSTKARIAPRATRVVIRAPSKGVMGDRRANTLPTSAIAAESAKRPRPKDHEDSNDRYPVRVPCWAVPQDLEGVAPRCITRARPRGNGAQLGSGWAPCRRWWALHHPSRACHTPRQPTMPQRGMDVHHKQRPTVETVAEGGWVIGIPGGRKRGIARAIGPANALLISLSGLT